MAEKNTPDAREQLTSAATTLQGVQTRLEQAAAQRRQDILDRIRRPRRAPESEDLADCLDLVHTASAYATVAQGLFDLGLLEAAQDTVSVGMAYVEAAQDCLDGLP